MRDSFLIFGAPKIEQPEIDEVAAVVRSGWLGTGPRVAEFERDFAAYKGVASATAVSSCTAALHLSLLTAGIGPGDEVITTPMTFCATVNVIIHAGATPVLADIDPATLNIDPARVSEKITPRTKAILPVHFAGRIADMDSLCAIAQRSGLRIIEDCAHAIETEARSRKAGTFGDFGCFSFYANKNVVTGEGGMVLARREEDLATIKMLALHGMSRDAWKRFSAEGYSHYQVIAAGYKYNMMDLQAALGIHQLRKVESSWRRRQEIWRRYQQAFANLPLVRPTEPEPGTRSAYHLYTVRVDKERSGIDRDAFLNAMTAQKIGVGVHYRSIPEHPFYREQFGWRLEDYPNAVRVGQETASLPLSPKMTDQDVDDVIEAVHACILRPRA